jgi:hypothetical protein
MTRAEIIAWTDEAVRRAAEDKAGAPLTAKQLKRVGELKQKAPGRFKTWLARARTWCRVTDYCDDANRNWA